MASAPQIRAGNRLRIVQVNHREPMALNAPGSGWQAVDEPNRYGNEQLPPPRFEQSLDDAPASSGIRSQSVDRYQRGPAHEVVPPYQPAPPTGDRDTYGSAAPEPPVPGHDLQRQPQDIDRNLEELLPELPQRRAVDTSRHRALAPNEMAFPVQQPPPGGMQQPGGLQPPIPFDRGGPPGPLDCADLDRFYDPTLFSAIGIDISIKGEAPPDCPLPQEAIFPNHPIDVYHRDWACLTYTWKASAICHKPLYFEERSVERYGHSWGLAQPLVSGAHFFGSIAVLPYKMGVHPPGECIYPLGYYRPGSCAPKIWYQAPLSLRGALAQGGVVTGLVFLLP